VNIVIVIIILRRKLKYLRIAKCKSLDGRGMHMAKKKKKGGKKSKQKKEEGKESKQPKRRRK
jgi:putative component of membrane protein insertase Oxa1/YidC/SpoIIIJ protein YidD